MKHQPTDTLGRSKKAAPARSDARDTSRPDTKSATVTPSSAPSDEHTMGRVSDKDYLK